MMTNKKIILVLVGLLFLAPAFAGLGVGVSPAGGTWTFGRQGGTIQMQLINSGNEDADYVIEFVKCDNEVCKDSGGNPITYATQWATLSDTKKRITAGDFTILYITVRPDNTVEFNKKYVLLVKVTPQPIATPGSPGSGAGMSISGQSGLDIIFSPTISGPTQYTSVDEAETRAARKKVQVNYLPLVVTVALILLLIVALFVFLFLKKKKEKEGSGDLVVEQKAPPKQ